MMDKNHDFYFYFNNDELKIIIERFGTNDRDELKEKIKFFILENKEPLDIDEDTRYKKLRNDHTEIKIKIDKKKLSFMNNFDDEPSVDGEKAIIEGVKRRDLTDLEFESVKKYITIRQDNYNHSMWIGKCDLCKESESYDSYKELLNDMVRHLTADHTKKVMIK